MEIGDLEHSWSHAGNLIGHNQDSYFTYIPCTELFVLMMGYKCNVIFYGLYL